MKLRNSTARVATLVFVGVALTLPVVARAADIQPVTSNPIQPVTSTPVQPTPPGPTPTVNAPHVPRVTLRYFYGGWKTWVPGAAYVLPGPTNNSPGTQHTSPGTAATGRLAIRANHTYSWEGHRGRWRATGDSEYPLVLLRAVDGHDWKVGADVKHRIVVWDGYTYYDGKR